MRTLVYLGLINAWRNLGRSFLAVLAMGLAAMLMTGSLTLGQGYTSQRSVEYRAYLGGDVLVYPTWTWPTEADVAKLADGSARLAVLPASFGSPLSYFHPDYYREGYLTTAASISGYSMFASGADYRQSVDALLEHPAVRGLEPYRSVPVIAGSVRVTGHGGAQDMALAGFHLRSLPPNLLTDPPPGTPPEFRPVEYGGPIPAMVTVAHSAGEILSDVKFWDSGFYVVNGRLLSSTDTEAALINRRALIPRDQLGMRGIPIGDTGQVVTLSLPTIVPGDPERGIAPYYDYSRRVTINITLVGTYDLASRLYHWIIAKGQSGYEQLYLESPEILLSPAAFDKVLAAMGLPPGETPPVGALTLQLGDLSETEAVVDELRQAHPEFSFVSVAQETAFANARALPERIYACPFEMRPQPLPLRQPAVPADQGDLLGVVLFGFAGLVAAGNSTLMVLSRRTEFAILKAIGLRGFEVGAVVLVEVMTLSVIGLLAGFGLAEVGNLPIILTNRVSLATVLGTLAADFALVAGATLSCAVIFALIPVLKTLRITVAEAMRGNG